MDHQQQDISKKRSNYDQQPSNKRPQKSHRKSRRTQLLQIFARNILQNDIIKRCSHNFDYCFLIGSEQKTLDIYMKYKYFFFLIQAERIGSPSRNGFNYLLHYSRELHNNKTVHSTCVLKSPMHTNSDNLLYEYVVGKFLNDRLSKTCPFFVYTHALYMCENPHIRDTMERSIRVPCEFIKDNLTLLSYESDTTSVLQQSYDDPLSLSLLIEGVSNGINLSAMLQDDIFYRTDLVPVLLQIYSTLHKYKDEFTHYDLHAGNVLLTGIHDSYFEYTFRQSGLVMNSRYLVKIIDYGTAYTSISEHFISSLCEAVPPLQSKRLCDRTSLDETDLNGYEWSTVEPENFLTQTKIVSVKNNISTDLKLLNIILKNHYASKFIERQVPQLYAFGNKIVYEGEFVTTEIKTDGYPHRINNVTDAYVMLFNIVQQNDAYRNNYSHLKKIEIILDM